MKNEKNIHEKERKSVMQVVLYRILKNYAFEIKIKMRAGKIYRYVFRQFVFQYCYI